MFRRINMFLLIKNSNVFDFIKNENRLSSTNLWLFVQMKYDFLVQTTSKEQTQYVVHGSNVEDYGEELRELRQRPVEICKYQYGICSTAYQQ